MSQFSEKSGDFREGTVWIKMSNIGFALATRGQASSAPVLSPWESSVESVFNDAVGLITEHWSADSLIPAIEGCLIEHDRGFGVRSDLESFPQTEMM